MTDKSLGDVVRNIRRAAGLADADALTDGQLLERFLAGEQTAFDGLVERHAALVWGVCRRLLHEPHDAEDAFQSTFLVLVRKAKHMEIRPALGSWLYGVAYRVALQALKARARSARRLIDESRVSDMSQDKVAAEAAWSELRPVLDEEVNGLPEKYRAPLILCYFQGKTNEQAAQLLGWPLGSISKKLARGRDLLRQRLARHGVECAPAVLVAVLAENAARAAPLRTLVHSTSTLAGLVAVGNGTTVGLASESVAQLTEEVVRTMVGVKVRMMTWVLAGCVAMAVSLTGLLAQPAAEHAAPPAPDAVKQPAPEQGELNAANAAKLKMLILPQQGENAFWQVAWESDIWTARQKAAARGKPIFVWGGSEGPPVTNC